MPLCFKPVPNEVEIDLPTSKSISNRLLILQTLYPNIISISGLSNAQDTRLLHSLIKSNKSTLNCKDAGTVLRFLLAYFAIQDKKKIILTGSKRLCERPIKPLVNALIQLGAKVEYLKNEGFAPLKITGSKIKKNKVELSGSESSQFISALCLIAPALKNGLEIKIKNKSVSVSYIEMTLDILSQLGINSTILKNKIKIPNVNFVHPQNINIEADWSAATFFYCMKLLNPKLQFTLPNLHFPSIQGDSFIQKIVDEKILESSTELDVSNYPDLAIPLIIICAVKFPKIKLAGISHLAYKESNRIEAMNFNLKKFGYSLILENDKIGFKHYKKIPKNNSIIKIKTYNDHRIAMAFSLFCLVGHKIDFDNWTCVQKSFPNYWEEIEKLGFKRN